MGIIGKLLGGGNAASLGDAVTGVAEVFRPNATEKMRLEKDAFLSVLQQFGAEFKTPGEGRFDRLVNGLNRLPRPLLALGTLGLFIYSMVDPVGFSARMTGLGYVPEPLWWLLGAIVSFYFGAREMHYARGKMTPDLTTTTQAPDTRNPALAAWRTKQAAK